MGLEQFVDRAGVLAHDLEDGPQRVVGREIGGVELQRLLILPDRQFPFLLPDVDLRETHVDVRVFSVPSQGFPIRGDGLVVHGPPLVHHAQELVGLAVPG